MIVLLMVAALAGPMAGPVAPAINCRPKELWRRQSGQTCLTPGPTIAPAHLEAVRRQLKSLIQAKGEPDPATAEALRAESAKAMAAKGNRRRVGRPSDLAPFRQFVAHPGPRVSPYAN